MSARHLAPFVLSLVLLGTLTACQSDEEPFAPVWQRYQTPESLYPDAGQRYRVDVLTFSPGAAIWSIWGHTAIRVFDSERKIDYVFDYGMFDLSSQASFVTRFLQGRPAFMLGAVTLDRTLYAYDYQNRRVYAQQLFVSDAEAEAILERLLINALPENRSFLYHHFLDNCTTRVRDIVSDAVGGRLEERFASVSTEHTHRSLSMDMMIHRPVLWTGTNIIMTGTVDKELNAWEQMFLPLDFMTSLEKFRTEGTIEPRIGRIQIVQDYRLGEPETDGVIAWFLYAFFWIGFLGLIAWSIVLPDSGLARFGLYAVWIFWNLLAGVLGLVVSFLWFGANHETLDHNWNLLALGPWLVLLVPLSYFLAVRPDLNARLHALLLAIPCIGLVLNLVIGQQFSWPFLAFAVITQALFFFAFRRQARRSSG